MHVIFFYVFGICGIVHMIANIFCHAHSLYYLNPYVSFVSLLYLVKIDAVKRELNRFTFWNSNWIIWKCVGRMELMDLKKSQFIGYTWNCKIYTFTLTVMRNERYFLQSFTDFDNNFFHFHKLFLFKSLFKILISKRYEYPIISGSSILLSEDSIHFTLRPLHANSCRFIPSLLEEMHHLGWVKFYKKYCINENVKPSRSLREHLYDLSRTKPNLKFRFQHVFKFYAPSWETVSSQVNFSLRCVRPVWVQWSVPEYLFPWMCILRYSIQSHFQGSAFGESHKLIPVKQKHNEK